ncbi:MAG: alpha-amylase family glycosyl hydrolase [Spirochaetota bacterium]|nr:alpha-amylase family glycosyl hydrolase [Spirochaetota bacterium]
MIQSIESLLEFIYGAEAAADYMPRLAAIMNDAGRKITAPVHRGAGELPMDHTDAVLITYGDSLQSPRKKHLATLRDFTDEKLRDIFSGIHILPFFPYSSDDGFSIIDYYEVNPELGTWNEIREIGSVFKIMSDLVLNHCSAQNEWFQRFLRNEEEYRDYFIDIDPEIDLSMIVRPRTHPLLTEFPAEGGPKHVWTTFSADQVDLNFGTPKVFLEMVKVLLFHIEQGIQIIRLDAIAYLWKEIGHPSIHHEKTHAVVKLFRAILERVAPWVVIITETNVPHQENISYFGNMDDEAHMIYQFSLPPLVLDAFLRNDSGHLQEWASELPDTLGKTTFFNFLASHDGIGILPANGILTPDEINGLVQNTLQRGGFINYKATPQGDIPYEMNITYLDAVAEQSLPASIRARKFLASQAIMIMLRGVPGIYIHSLLGSGNYREGVEKTGQNRSINREKLSYEEVKSEINTPGTLRNRIFSGFKAMLRAKRSSRAFDPAGRMEILPTESSVFGILRMSPDNDEYVIALVNVSPDISTVSLPIEVLPKPVKNTFRELIGGETMVATLDRNSLRFQLAGYGVYWLQ